MDKLGLHIKVLYFGTTCRDEKILVMKRGFDGDDKD